MQEEVFILQPTDKYNCDKSYNIQLQIIWFV